MSKLTARFGQSPVERKRYILDLDLELDSGELVEGIVANVTTPTDSDVLIVVDDIVVAPSGRQATFYVSLGEDQGSYLIQFLSTTSLEKVLETVVQFDIASKVSA